MFLTPPGHFQPVLAMKFLVESEFQGQGAPKPQETTKTTGTIRTPRVGFGTDRPYIALFWYRPSVTDVLSVPCWLARWHGRDDGERLP